ncbi:MAG: MFS transporter [Candidatus Nitrohelix vancouverensis]|uniref:MFS transporter n=1 Tax=Candidatus Nitrohelix vancouverensis TaxID=2705534 RepID=A0A7T0C526_9BACT|nr:MAG: MFS transporter [Candidatus Nitrohelix vancouverensis]
MPHTFGSEYITILKQNPSFRNLWYGQVISELGDWLNSIAIYALILELGDSGMALAGVMMAKLFPFVLVSPIAGVVVDRFSRKWVMILSDLGRFLLVLGFLAVDSSDDVWLIFSLTALAIALAGFFEPARSAIIPSLIPRKDLVVANALSSSTWSIMLAFGAAVGGVVVSIAGIRTAFLLDAVTFLFSAWFIFKLPEEKEEDAARARLSRKDGGWKNFIEGVKYLLSEPIILALSLLKSGLALAGCVMTLAPLYAHQMYARPQDVSLAIGLLYASRGVGAALGPPLVRKYFGDSAQVLHISIGAGFLLSGFFYYLFSFTTTLGLACTMLGLATLSGSLIWVFSSALIHMEAKGPLLGRVFSAELALMTLIMGLSNWAAGASIDYGAMTAYEVSRWMAVLITLPGFIWFAFVFLVRKRLAKGKCVGSVCSIDPSGFNPVAPMSGDTIEEPRL